MKNLDKFFSKADLPWIKLIWNKYYSNGSLPGNSMNDSFWWRSILRLLNIFKGIASSVNRNWRLFCSGKIFGMVEF
jgi:hypothetical protein